MLALSRTFKDRPMTPQQSVVYWTEYVIRHNGARHLKTLGMDMPMYKYFMLDIIVLLLISMSVVIYIIYAAFKKILLLILRKPKYAILVKKDE